jgi:hypothetical protein
MGQWRAGYFLKRRTRQLAYIGLPTQSRNSAFIDSTPMFLVWLLGVTPSMRPIIVEKRGASTDANRPVKKVY